ncbi:MAG: ATP-binding protein [Deltaproteobacteria bacterium]|nr:ATP-binding protein [Deltaproteobacteria bacterium]
MIASEPRVATLVNRVPIAEIANGVVLNVDGSLAVGLEVQPLDHTASSSLSVGNSSRIMSELLRWLPEGTILQLLVEVSDSVPSSVAAFVSAREAAAKGASPAALLCSSVVEQARKQKFRSVRMFLFVCQPYHFQQAALVRSGAMPSARPRWTADTHDRALRALEDTAKSAEEQLRAAGLVVSRATDQSLLALVRRQLNPGRELPAVTDGAGLDASGGARELDPRLTLRERLCATHFELSEPGSLRIGKRFVQTLSVRDLPDVTRAGLLAPIFFELEGPALVSISVEKLPTHLALAGLKMRRSMAHTLLALSARRNIDAEVQHSELEALMEGLSRSAMCVCAVQVTCALLDRDHEHLEERVSRTEQVFARAGGFSTLVEDYNHLDVYLAMLPGAAHRFRRTRTVHDGNAAHMLLPFGAWRGSRRAAMLLRTRSADAVPFDPFSDDLPAFNGLVVGASGSGKSFFTNLMLANHLALGGGAVVIDIGGSYRRLTEIFGGTYVDIGVADGIGLNPLPSREEMAGLSEEEREMKLQYLAGFLELLGSETSGMPTSERAIVSKALGAFYAAERGRSPTVPTLREFCHFLQSFGESDDHLVALKLVRRLELWTDGPRARLFERGANLSLGPSIVAIDLKAVEADRELQAVALYVLSFVIWSKLGARDQRRQTLVVFDECWALLNNPPAARLIENLVRTARKYGAGLWCLSQSAEDFLSSSIGPALLSNSFTRVLLRHAFGHERVAQVFGLTDYSEAAFRSLGSKAGEYAEAFLQVGDKAELVQVSPSPLGYWMATTSAKDRDAERMLRRANPNTPFINLLSALAERFPKGV